MLDRLGIAVLAALVLAACEPKALELEGEPALDGAPAASSDAPGELAGATPAAGAILTDTLNFVPPVGVEVIPACERIVAPDYDKPPQMTCLLLQAADLDQPEVDQIVLDAMKAAGWQYVRALGAERYFERPKLPSDCADVAALSVVGEQLDALVAHAAADDAQPNVLPTHIVWRAYAIPHTIREACGADRMKP